MRQPSIAISIVVVLAGAQLPALAATIEGRVWISKQAERSVVAVETRNDGRRSGAERRAEVARIVRGVTDAIVYLETVPPDVDRRFARRSPGSSRSFVSSVAMNGRRFVPAASVTQTGSEIRIRNLDGVYHHLFGRSTAGEIDLGAHAPGSEATVTVRMPGEFHLFCRMHSDELGRLLVIPHHAWTQPDSIGRFKLAGLPSGNYRLRVWHPRLGSEAHDVRLRGRARIALAL